jgi:hypothetical protein
MIRPPASLQAVARSAGEQEGIGTRCSEHTTPLPLRRNRLRKWVKAQEDTIEQVRIVASKAFAAGDLAKCLEAHHLAMRAQAELIALVAPKRTVKSKAPTEAEAEPDADDNDTSVAPEVVEDMSKLSEEELERIVGEPPPKAEKASSTSPVAAERTPPPRRGRPKGYEASGAAKEAKERAHARRANEEREREARAQQMRRYDAANTWPMIPEEWED